MGSKGLTMTDERRRRLLLYTFLYLVALVLALIVYDVDTVGVRHEEIGLSSANVWFRNLFDYSEETGYFEPLYYLSKVLMYVSIAPCALWTVLYVKEHIRERSLSGVGVDKNLMSTFWLYLITAFICFIFWLAPVNHSPVLMEGQSEPSVSFPAISVVIYIIAWMSTIFQIKDYLDEKKTLRRIITVASCVIMGVGIIASLLSGVYWLTDVGGGILLGGTLVLLATFFYDF